MALINKYFEVELLFELSWPSVMWGLSDRLDRAGLDQWQILLMVKLSMHLIHLCNGDHFNLIKNGNLRIALNFSANLPDNLNCVVNMEHENIIEINKSRNVLYDFEI